MSLRMKTTWILSPTVQICREINNYNRRALYDPFHLDEITIVTGSKNLILFEPHKGSKENLPLGDFC
jgi:hypothetical protein